MKTSLYLFTLILVTTSMTSIQAAQEPAPAQNQVEQNEDELKAAAEERVVAVKNSIGAVLQAMSNQHIELATKKYEHLEQQRAFLIAQLTTAGKTQQEIDAAVQALEQEFNQQQE